MKRKDGKGSEDLKIICYDAFHSENPTFFKDEKSKLSWLTGEGFTVVAYELFNTPEEVVSYRNMVMDKRNTYDVDIDGLVVKGLDIDREDMKRARPEKQIAFKFSPEEAVSVLKGVEWSESGSTYTPIGLIEPVHLAGTTVKRANLCNPKMIADMNLRIGSKIVITKRGEIIPKIEDVVENPPDATPVKVPDTCRVCGSALTDEGTRLFCPNPGCEKKKLFRIEKWIKTLDIKEFGGVLIRNLFNSGRVNEIADLYTLEESDITVFERMGEGIAKKALKNLYSVKEIPLSKFIAGFNIEGIGELLVDKIIAKGFDSLEKMRCAPVDEIALAEGIGFTTAEIFKEGLIKLQTEMENVLRTGQISVTVSRSGKLADMSFCFTGTLNTMSRNKAEELVVQLGGMVKKSVTQDLSYLVTNNPESGSSKNRKAGEMNIPIINEEEFLDLADYKTKG
jgi:DNA ligase (NAD+)